MDLKQGDIKKFKLSNGQESVGVVVGLESKAVTICTVKGVIANLWKETFEVSTTRLDPKVREALIEVGKEYIISEGYKKEIEKIRLKQYKQEEVINNKKLALMKLGGYTNSNEFLTLLYKYLSPAVADAIKRNGYTLNSVSVHNNTIVVRIEKGVDIVKYADDRQYSFIYREYDNTLFIDEDDLNYKKMVKQYSINNLLLSSKDKKALKVEDISSIDLGDKYLSFSHCINIQLKGSDLTKDNAKVISKLIDLKK